LEDQSEIVEGIGRHPAERVVKIKKILQIFAWNTTKTP
jgi:hypothetical protein